MRTWDYVHKPTLDFYDSLSDNVDYYVSTWKTPKFNPTKISYTFEGRNLVQALFISPVVETGMCHGFKGPGYQANRLLPYKRLREKEIGKYDAVIDTRFDIMATREGVIDHTDGKRKIIYNEFTKIEPNTLYTDRINYGVEQEPGTSIARPNDHWFIMSSDMYTIFTERYIRDEKYSAHEEFALLAQDEGWELKETPWIRTMITRPNIMDVIVDPYTYFDMERQGILPKGLYDYNKDWMEMSVEDRIEMCEKKYIDPVDYDFQNTLINDGAVG
jgi:hypothetical protein